jgi:hypothetical protein
MVRGLAVVVCLAIAAPLLGQETAARTDSDPTRPILFSVRPEFSQVADSVWRLQLIARYDAAVVRRRRWFSGKRGLLLRFEVPLAAADGPSIETRAGLGDAYGQVLLVPKLSSRFALVAGSGLSLPTATSDPLGTGKWTAAPVIAPVWFLRGAGLAYVKLQNFTSFAGDAARPDFNVLLITPTVIRSFHRSWWYLADTETSTNWNKGGRTGVKSGLQIGHVFGNGLGFWMKPEVWWGPNRSGQWNLKTGFVWYRPN